MIRTFLTVLGSSASRYDAGNDTASYLINNRVIVDTGWHLVAGLEYVGLDPAAPDTLLLTHMHQDHYMSLPQLLFYRLGEGKGLGSMRIVGTSETAGIVRRALDFLQIERFYPDAGVPQCAEIAPNQSMALDGEGLRVEAWRSLHPVEGRYYRLTDENTGAVIGLSGDTAYSRDEGAFFKGCDLLVHECSLGGAKGETNGWLHSDAADAGRVAAEAGVKRLMLTHYPARVRQECVDAARSLFGGEILTPVRGDVIYF